MSPQEESLVAKGPTFADLCEEVRRTRKAHARSIEATDAARERVKELQVEQDAADDAASFAMRALDDFIDRELEDGE